jgi:hypothetical protein
MCSLPGGGASPCQDAAVASNSQTRRHPTVPAWYPAAGRSHRTKLTIFVGSDPAAGSGIDIRHGAEPPADSSKRFRSLDPSGRAASRDQRPSAPDQRFPEAPHGPWFASQTAPAGPNAHKSPRLASQQAATHNDAPRDRPSGSQRTPNRRPGRSRHRERSSAVASRTTSRRG